MRILRMATLTLLSLCLAAAAVAADYSPQIFRLQNGLTVLVLEDARFPLASVRLYVKAGAAWERPEEAGMSHMLEHMVFKGSKTRPQGVDKSVEGAGGYLNAYTSYDETVYLTDMPGPKWRTGMEAVRDLAFDPLLRQADLDAEREVVIAELKQRGDSPFRKISETMFATTLKGTPYERPVIGTEQTLRAMTPESIRAYIDRQYDPRDMLLVVVGDVKAMEVFAEAKTLFGGYANKNNPAVPGTVLPGAPGFQESVQEGDWNKVYFSMAFPMPDLNDARSAAVGVLTELLGGGDTALLPRKLRFEKPLVDDISVFASPFARSGVMAVTAVLDADKLPAFRDTLLSELNSLSAASFSAEELNRVKLNTADSVFRARETVAGMAGQLGSNTFYTPEDPVGDNALRVLNQVSEKEVQEAIDQWLRPEAASVVMQVPRGTKAADFASAQKKLWPGKEIKKADSAQAGRGAVDVVKLGPGRTVVLVPDTHLPYTSLTLAFNGGESLLEKDRQGLNSFTSSLLTQAAGKLDSQAMRAFLADRAASLTASGSYNNFTLRMESPSRFDTEMFALLGDVLTAPSFAPDDLERIKREQIADIVSQQEDQQGLIGRNLRPFLFPDSVYGHYLDGTPEGVGAFTAEQARDFWKRQSRQPWVLAVAGAFDREQVLAFARSLPVPAAETVKAGSPAWTKDKALELKLPGREQAFQLLLFPTVPLSHPDSPALQLLSGALDGFSGMLMQELREKRSLGYSVGPMNWPGQDVGFLAFYIVAAPGNLPEADAAFADIVRRLKTELLPVEVVDKAKATAEANFYRSSQKLGARSVNAAVQVLNDRSPDFPRERLEELKKLTPEDLREAARKYLDSEKAYVARVTP